MRVSLLKDRVVGLRVGTGKVGTEGRAEESAGWTSLMDCVWPLVERTEAANYVANSAGQYYREGKWACSRTTKQLRSKQAVRTKLAGDEPGGGGQTNMVEWVQRRREKKTRGKKKKRKNSNTPNS